MYPSYIEMEFMKGLVRIANTSSPDECKTEGYSQTACGFVVEFVDIITTYHMNPADENGNSVNIGGWKDSAMRTYVNNTIYNSFPSSLKENIIDTYVVSGHEYSVTENYKTIDKIYLLSAKELWKDYTMEIETRQLDYYKSKGVTTSNYSGAIKNYNGNAYVWFLRSPDYATIQRFCYVFNDGKLAHTIAIYNYGVTPAFRLG